MKKKIVVLDGYSLNPGDLDWSGLKELGDLTVYDRTAGNQITERIGDAEIIFTNKTQLTENIFEKCPSIKYVGVLATGYNVVDITAAVKRGITVTNIPAYSTEAVTQHATALLLELCNRVGEHNEAVKAGQWSSSPDFCFWNHPLIELSGRTLGIVGFGRIGQSVAKVAVALGMNVLANATRPNHALETDRIKYADLENLFKSSDVISLHAPLTEQTREIINKDSISKMKDGVIIINTSRGPLINEQALADALNSGKVSAAAMDVVSVEPISESNPLLKAKNCILTPHIAWAPFDTRVRLMEIAVSNLKNFLSGTSANVVG